MPSNAHKADKTMPNAKEQTLGEKEHKRRVMRHRHIRLQPNNNSSSTAGRRNNHPQPDFDTIEVLDEGNDFERAQEVLAVELETGPLHWSSHVVARQRISPFWTSTPARKLRFLFQKYFLTSYRNWKHSDAHAQLLLSAFLFGSWSKPTMWLDYAGISLLIIGSFVPWLYYAFYCRALPMAIYISMIVILGIAALVVSLFDKFAQPKFRPLRAIVFMAMGLSSKNSICRLTLLYTFSFLCVAQPYTWCGSLNGVFRENVTFCVNHINCSIFSSFLLPRCTITGC
uniref:Transmembrane protein n=1 Tax=Globodera pallida TaxID=36090 RepID=A0A183BT00_GLOPA